MTASPTSAVPLSNADAVTHQTWDLEYDHALGEAASTFLNGLAREEIWGTRCPKCTRVIVPPRAFCDRCLRRADEWVRVEPVGVLEMATVVEEPFRGLPAPPYAIGYVRPDGADTAMIGFIRGVDLTDSRRAMTELRLGTRMRVVFPERKTGTVLDYAFVAADTAGK